MGKGLIPIAKNQSPIFGNLVKYQKPKRLKAGHHMLKRKSLSFLFVWILLTFIVISSILNPLPVYAETEIYDELPNGQTKYINKKMGFELTFPESWKGKFSSDSEFSSVDFWFQFKDTVYSNSPAGVPPLFTIYIGSPNVEHKVGQRWTRELFTKGDKSYYVMYYSLRTYSNKMPPGPASDELFSLLKQLEDVLNTFQLLDTEEQKAEAHDSSDTVHHEAEKVSQPNDEPFLKK